MTKEQELKELTRDRFIDETGVFVSHLYFDDMIHDDYLENGLTQKEFCNDWLVKNKPLIETLESDDTFHYIIDDDEISCIENEDIDELSKEDIIDSLSESTKYWRDRADELKETMKGISQKIDLFLKTYDNSKKSYESQIALLKFMAFRDQFNYLQLLKQISNTEGDSNDDIDLEIRF